MKNVATLFFLIIVLSVTSAYGQNLYNPKADAKADIAAAVKKAKAEGKHVLIQVGGNWCPWCIKLHAFIDDNSDIKTTINGNFVFILVNYSKENKNMEVMKQLEYPNRFGFPILVILDANGKRIHTQATDYLENNNSYDLTKVQNMLKQWSPKALNPANYK